METARILIYSMVLLQIWYNFVESEGSLTFKNWNKFPPGAAMGIFLAVALPLNLPSKNAYMAYNFEANYILPRNVSDLTYPPIIGRQSTGVNRQLVYDAIESKMAANGLSGKACLLRTICEAAIESLQNNGLIGDILHIILTPSTSDDEKKISNEYEKAEQAGKNKNCSKYSEKCSISFLEIISWIGEAI